MSLSLRRVESDDSDDRFHFSYLGKLLEWSKEFARCYQVCLLASLIKVADSKTRNRLHEQWKGIQADREACCSPRSVCPMIIWRPSVRTDNRPRGWHLTEPRMLIDGEPISGSLFDFGLYFFNNAAELIKRGYGPYFYLPKMEHYLEARLWNDVFSLSTSKLGLKQGCIRGTVLIETLPAAFQMEEILYELKEHSSGLNCGRWDYIFSL